MNSSLCQYLFNIAETTFSDTSAAVQISSSLALSNPTHQSWGLERSSASARPVAAPILLPLVETDVNNDDWSPKFTTTVVASETLSISNESVRVVKSSCR